MGMTVLDLEIELLERLLYDMDFSFGCSLAHFLEVWYGSRCFDVQEQRRIQRLHLVGVFVLLPCLVIYVPHGMLFLTSHTDRVQNPT